MSSKRLLQLVYFDAGGGHRSAALALQSVIASKDLPWNVELVNLQDILDSLDVFRKITGLRMQDIYNLVLARGWTLGSAYLLPPMHGIIGLYHSRQVKLLTAYWTKSRPDMVVSLVPNFNRALFQSLKQALPSVPFATVLTDFADFPPHFWMEQQPEQYLICGTPYAYQQALALGQPASRTFLTSGMILRPEFYQKQEVDRAAERFRLGLDPSLPVGLLLFGGEGSSKMRLIAERLGNSETGLQLIVICGRNHRLKDSLQRLRTRNKLHLEGFTKQIPYFMNLSDFLIGKPGPGSLAEALQMNLPVIVESNAWTLPQERYNTRWITEQGVGLVLSSFTTIETAVSNLLNGDRLKMFKDAVNRLENRAVFEVPEILTEIYERAAQPAAHGS